MTQLWLFGWFIILEYSCDHGHLGSSAARKRWRSRGLKNSKSFLLSFWMCAANSRGTPQSSIWLMELSNRSVACDCPSDDINFIGTGLIAFQFQQCTSDQRFNISTVIHIRWVNRCICRCNVFCRLEPQRKEIWIWMLLKSFVRAWF